MNVAATASDRDGKVWQFRNYTLCPRSRELLLDGKAVPLGGRAFDILLALASRAGEVVSKEDLMAAVWPTTCVEESNLRVQMSNLREMLGIDGNIIRTVSGRGYVFAADIATREGLDPSGYGAQADQLGGGSHDDRPGTAVVLIDDDDEVRAGIEGLFSSVGLAVVGFRSPLEFQEKRHAVRPTCFVLDVMMPGQTGLEFMDSLVDSACETPVIFISGHADVRASVRAMKAGALDFFTKPLDHELLVIAVREAVSRGSQPERPSHGQSSGQLSL